MSFLQTLRTKNNIAIFIILLLIIGEINANEAVNIDKVDIVGKNMLKVDGEHGRLKHIVDKNFFTSEDLKFASDKDDISLARDFKGYVVILHFWATWCVECIDEMKELDNLAGKMSELGVDKFAIIPVNIDFNALDNVKNFYLKHNIKHIPLIHDQSNSYHKLRLQAIPSTIIINRNGNAVGLYYGQIRWFNYEVIEYLELLTK